MKIIVRYTNRASMGPRIGRGHLEDGGSLDGNCVNKLSDFLISPLAISRLLLACLSPRVFLIP
jgi:hypothetical protein